MWQETNALRVCFLESRKLLLRVPMWLQATPPVTCIRFYKCASLLLTDFQLDMLSKTGAELPKFPLISVSSCSFLWSLDRYFRDPGPSLAGEQLPLLCAASKSKGNERGNII